MLRAVNASNGPVSAAPNPVREAQAVSASAGATAQASPVASVETSGAEQRAPSNALSFRYNSTEFVYRQDIGRIVLVGQSPETGERTIQIPSEEALRAYERTMRSEERQTLLASGQSTPQLQAAIPAPVSPAPKAVPLPSLQQAIGAVFGANDSSAVVSVSA